MIITIGNYKINPDHISRLGTDPTGRPFMVMVGGESLPVYSGTEEELADRINGAIRREKQRDQGCHKEFTQFGLV